MTFLAPDWLWNLRGIISYILAAVVLVIFSDPINKYVVFPVADYVKENTHKKIFKSKHPTKETLAKYTAESLATIIFIIYCYLGSDFLAKHFFGPVLNSFKEFFIIAIIIIFFLISFIINNKKVRGRFMQF